MLCFSCCKSVETGVAVQTDFPFDKNRKESTGTPTLEVEEDTDPAANVHLNRSYTVGPNQMLLDGMKVHATKSRRTQVGSGIVHQNTSQNVYPPGLRNLKPSETGSKVSHQETGLRIAPASSEHSKIPTPIAVPQPEADGNQLKVDLNSTRIDMIKKKREIRAYRS